MTDYFLTVEDLNSVEVNLHNASFWYETVIDIGSDAEFDGLKFDFLEVDRTLVNDKYNFKITVLNSMCRAGYFLDANGDYITGVSVNNKVVTLTSDTPVITCMMHITTNVPLSAGFNVTEWIISDVSTKFNLKTDNEKIIVGIEAVNPDFDPNGKTFKLNLPNLIEQSYECINNEIIINYPLDKGTLTYNSTGYYKINYKNYNERCVVIPLFDNLVMGEVNSLTFKTEHEVFLNDINVECDYPVLDVRTDESNVLIVDLDLRKLRTLKSVTLKIQTKYTGLPYYYSDDVFKFSTEYNTINTIADFTALCSVGGYARLGADLTLTDNIVLGGDVTLIGEDYSLDFDGYNITVPDGLTLKIENTTITNGLNTIKQNEGSTVELTGCTFANCTSVDGVGGVIDCNVNIGSLDNSDDFTTTIIDSTFGNCDCPILHGGDLTVQNCQITGKISNPTFPYFLYQTDGNAHINRNQFSITGESDEDIQFNSCIFTCGEKAKINGLDHRDLQKNDIKSFLEENSSNIDVSYYYAPIDNDVTITGSGFCHSVSSIAKIYKTQVTITRGE